MEELKDKYRSLPFWARLLMALIIGILPGACSYLEEADVLESTLTSARESENTARSNFENNRKEKANIPKLEEELAYTEEQLEKAKKKLPEGYLVEDVLSLAASSAKSAGVMLRRFTPTCELKGQGEFKYVEFPVNVQVSGKYQQIAAYLDKIVHAEMMIFVRGLTIALGEAPDLRDLRAETSEYERALRTRREQTLTADFQLVVFRGMKDEEESFFEGRTNCDDPADNLGAAPGAQTNLPQPVGEPVPAGAGDGGDGGGEGSAPPP